MTGIDLFSAGEFMGGEGTEEIVLSDPIGGVYKKLVIKDDKLVGACLYGDTVDGSWYFKLLREGTNIGDIRDTLMFGESNTGRPATPATKATPRPPRCRTTPKSAAATASARARSSRRSRKRACSRWTTCASTPRRRASCGSCTGLVEQIIMFTAGGDYSASSQDEADVRLHRPHPPGSARCDPASTSC